MVAEEGHCDREPMSGSVLQPHGGRRGGIHLGCGNVLLSRVDARPVGRLLLVGPTECH